MSDTVELPAVGPVKKEILVGVGAAVVIGVGYMYVRSARSATVEPATVDPNAGNSTGTFGADIGSGSGGYYATPSAASDTVVDTDDEFGVITTNAQWTRAAVDYLSENGRDSGMVQDALGKYLAGTPLTLDEKTIVQSAKGAIGNEPIPAPPMTGVSPPPTPSGPPPVVVPPPVVLKAPTLGHETITATTAVIKWSDVPGAKSYLIGRSGTTALEPSGTDRVETMRGLKPNTKYTFTVRAVGTDGKQGPVSAPHALTTKK